MKRGEFIARSTPDGWLMNYEALWAHTGRRPIATIRAHCVPIACDLRTRQLLYDATDSAARLAGVKARAPHRRQPASHAA